jgi:chromatin remodeling complex protein RSC6
LPRTEIVSKLWAYIKKNKLQDNVNKRMVNADAKLRDLVGKKQISMFELAGAISLHVGDPDPDDTNDPGPYIGRKR